MAREVRARKKCWAVDEAGLFGYGIFFSLSIFFFSGASAGWGKWGEGEYER
jgi:hypothetical protein